MAEVRHTPEFESWFEGLRDAKARARILVRIRRLSLDNPGDVRPVGHGVSEMRIDYGPGYRVYFLSNRQNVIVLLSGGNKGTQARDVEKARSLAREL